jgi:mono/diheme cytochrome c family protein
MLLPHSVPNHFVERSAPVLFRFALSGPVIALLSACDLPSPQAPADPIGEYPVWGQGFGDKASQPAGADSLLAGGMQGGEGGEEGPVPSGAPNAAQESGGGGSTTPNMPNPMANEDWSGGDVAYGQQVYLNNCARCHGAEGKGGNVPAVGMVPTLRDPGWHEKATDKHLASTIAHGKGAMPGFMEKFDGRQLRGVIAYVRTLKRTAAAPEDKPTEAPAEQPTEAPAEQPTEAPAEKPAAPAGY